jgi:hypothetical protein
MFQRKAVLAVLLGVVSAGLVGCMPRMTLEQFKAEMPKRPAELDRLNAFVGKWQSEGEAKFAMLDEPLKVTGTCEAKWEGDKWYLVGHAVMKMDDMPETKGMEAWTYDVHAKKYRSTYVDSMGMMGMSESRYDEKADTWYMTATTFGPWGQSQLKGTLRFVNPDTMEWSMTEGMGCMGLMKVMEMKGTGKRVK